MIERIHYYALIDINLILVFVYNYLIHLYKESVDFQ